MKIHENLHKPAGSTLEKGLREYDKIHSFFKSIRVNWVEAQYA